MEAKEFLQQVRRADIPIQKKPDELADLETLATKINAVNEGERVQSSSSQDSMAEAVCKIADLKKEIQSEIEELLQLKREVRAVISLVSEPDLMSVLYKRYIFYKKWEQIAVEINVSWRQALRLHGQALKEVEKILKLS